MDAQKENCSYLQHRRPVQVDTESLQRAPPHCLGRHSGISHSIMRWGNAAAQWLLADSV